MKKQNKQAEMIEMARHLAKPYPDAVRKFGGLLVIDTDMLPRSRAKELIKTAVSIILGKKQ